METPAAAGGTRGNALEASFEVKAQAVIVFWKLHANGSPKEKAYSDAAELVGCSHQRVRVWVRSEIDEGITSLHSAARLGRPTKFSPRKRQALEEAMAESKGELSLREASEALQAVGAGSSLETASQYVGKAGFKALTVRCKPMLSPANMQKRAAYCDSHFESDFMDRAMADEKLFVLGKGRSIRYVKEEQADDPCLRFVADSQHPPQVMVTAIVMRPRDDFDGKVALFISFPKEKDGEPCAWVPIQRLTKKRKAAGLTHDDWLINQKATLDGPGYAQVVQDEGLPALERTRKQLGLRTVKLQDDNAKPHVAAWDKHGLDKAAERARWSGARGAASWLSRP